MVIFFNIIYIYKNKIFYCIFLDSTTGRQIATNNNHPSSINIASGSETQKIFSPITNFSSDLSSMMSSNNPGFVTDDGLYAEGTTHPKALSIASKVCSNYSQATLYATKDVFTVELEEAILAQNEKNTSKFFGGVDVIYPTSKKVFTCVPLFCPAKIFGSKPNEIEVYVGICYDGNGAYPIMAVFDSHGTFKNLAKSRNVINTNFKRLCPTHITHDFSDAEINVFEDCF
jgi:hypothetical protein